MSIKKRKKEGTLPNHNLLDSILSTLPTFHAVRTLLNADKAFAEAADPTVGLNIFFMVMTREVSQLLRSAFQVGNNDVGSDLNKFSMLVTRDVSQLAITPYVEVIAFLAASDVPYNLLIASRILRLLSLLSLHLKSTVHDGISFGERAVLAHPSQPKLAAGQKSAAMNMFSRSQVDDTCQPLISALNDDSLNTEINIKQENKN